MAHVVIIGAGVGGMPMAYEMRDALRKEDKITVIGNGPDFQFTPSNPWVLVGWRKRKDVVVPVEKYLNKKGIDFVPVPVKKVHPDDSKVELADGQSMDYDYLVVASGPHLAFEEVEGLGPNGFTQSVCHVDHAVKAYEKWEEFCKNPGPIVVGAVQGASCYGPAYEMAMIMDTDLRRRKIRDKVPMTFVTAEPYVGHLGLGGVGDSKGLLESEFRGAHVKWICNAKVEKVEDGKMHVAEMNPDGSEKQKHEVDFKYSMMLPAFKGIEAVQGIEGLVNPRGFVTVNKFQQNEKFKNIYAVGVVVAIPPVEACALPVGAPKTGYMIESMVTATAHNVRNMIDGKSPDQEATWNAICLADFGDRGAAFVALPQIPPRNVNWFAGGKWVHLAKVAFEKYFIRKIKKGTSEPIYEKYTLKALGVTKLKDKYTEPTVHD
ncbi:NAD(P)/FAD-dependent oxidoreductase [Magnetospira sp. QH-2]|uniref:NAD(P)/FAD-dependent oxidoreductase n=1 Tax=Magnetospira sp. (strain QH-2) TaxID=1288970 RepID=UPI0003E80CD0|nr:FAD/NAD(P)-binding oxidoreductase [Magnetospira sp. QH-2]CCQ75177.1 putative sulfide-quinone reductase [Magnetospira sp. QH-2]